MNEKVTFCHSGRITVGNQGEKIEELSLFAAEHYPDIIDGECFCLGTLMKDHGCVYSCVIFEAISRG